MDKNAYEEWQGHQAAAVQKSGQWRAGEEVRCFPGPGRGTWLFAWRESRGQGAVSLGDADGFRHGKA